MMTVNPFVWQKLCRMLALRSFFKNGKFHMGAVKK